MAEELQLLKWNVWHGNVSRALKRIEELQLDLDTYAESENRAKLREGVLFRPAEARRCPGPSHP
jgi:hypothetical protein